MKTNLKLTMTMITAAGLLGASAAFGADFAAYGTKGAPAQTIAQDAKAVQGGLDGKRLASKGATTEEAKGISASPQKGELCSKKDAMAKGCSFHCGA